MKLSWPLLTLVLLAGCGPTLSESRLTSHRPRGDDCDLGLIQTNDTAKPLGDQWQVIGYVSIDGLGHTDPLARKNRDLVRGRICEMGGIAVAIAVSGMTGMKVNTNADATYAALRPAVEPAPEMPQRF